jgi:hypothetical protein
VRVLSSLTWNMGRRMTRGDAMRLWEGNTGPELCH